MSSLSDKIREVRTEKGFMPDNLKVEDVKQFIKDICLALEDDNVAVRIIKERAGDKLI